MNSVQILAHNVWYPLPGEYEMNDYRIVPIDMPYGVNGCIVKTQDYCTILVNARLTIEEQRLAAIHEIKHYELGHLDDLETPVSEKEKEIKSLALDRRASDK
jgi:hypothetical protein